MADQMVLGPYIASQVGRLRDALRAENEYNVALVLAEAEMLLSNPANQSLVAAESEAPSFELAMFRMWFTVRFGVLDQNYDATVTRRAQNLSDILGGMIREHIVMAYCRPGGDGLQFSPARIDLDR